VFAGYTMNLLAVPMMALAGHWEIAAVLMMAERTGKAIRNPARDVMISYASDRIGAGWGFGLHEFLDGLGAVIGPLIMAVILGYNENYRYAFAVLLIPALMALSVLFGAFRLYPDPRDLADASPRIESDGFPKAFWFYVVAIGFVAAGYADFPLVAFHFKTGSVVPDYWVPILYSVAMGVAAVSALIFGKLFDRMGFYVIIISILISAFFAPLVFWGGFYQALLGMGLWGLGMGAHESILRAAIASMVPKKRLGFAFGVYNTAFGLFWFAGSAAMGMLYDFSITALIVFSVVAQLISVPILLYARKGAEG